MCTDNDPLDVIGLDNNIVMPLANCDSKTITDDVTLTFNTLRCIRDSFSLYQNLFTHMALYCCRLVTLATVLLDFHELSALIVFPVFLSLLAETLFPVFTDGRKETFAMGRKLL